MTIKQLEVTVGEITMGYVNNDEQGVRGYYGKLDIRPPYQREFVYKEKERNAVISTVMRGFPLNVMYWVRLPAEQHVLGEAFRRRRVSLRGDGRAAAYAVHL